MKKLPILFISFLAFSASPAFGTCKRLPFDSSNPLLAGQYEIVGRDQQSGAAYTGSLLVAGGKKGYVLTRTIQGKSVNGESWMELCGFRDKVELLIVRYFTKPLTELVCYIKADHNNYFRISCGTQQIDKTWSGLEAWFQHKP